jgi:hypothetical protein
VQLDAMGQWVTFDVKGPAMGQIAGPVPLTYSPTSFAREGDVSLDLDQAELVCAAGQSGSMSRNALILVAWYSWLAVLVGVLVYVLV